VPIPLSELSRVLRMDVVALVQEATTVAAIVKFFLASQYNIETRVMSKYRDLAWNNFTQCGGMLLKHTHIEENSCVVSFHRIKSRIYKNPQRIKDATLENLQ